MAKKKTRKKPAAKKRDDADEAAEVQADAAPGDDVEAKATPKKKAPAKKAKKKKSSVGRPKKGAGDEKARANEPKKERSGGDLPLWGYPWVTMRGIPALRYQNESTAVFATELRWNFASRWAAVGFLGVGGTWGDVPIFEDESGIVAGGVGGRFHFRPQDDLWVGIDVAKGPEQYVLYIVAGHKW